MERLDKRLFKKNRPVIRPMRWLSEGDSADTALIWDCYCRGQLEEIEEGLTMQDFMEATEVLRDYLQEIYIVEDLIGEDYVPIALVLCRNDGWLLEPHVIYFHNATTRHKLRGYTAFLKHTKYRKDLGACLIRVTKDTTPMANKMTGIGLLEYVGKIWGGRPSGNEYLYSVRCQRRA